MTDAVLRKTVFLKAKREDVWAYLTDPDKLGIWFHKPKAPLAMGGYEMFGSESGDRLMSQSRTHFRILSILSRSHRWAMPLAQLNGSYPKSTGVRAYRLSIQGYHKPPRRLASRSRWIRDGTITSAGCVFRSSESRMPAC
jgi:hypothetical protein